ncbi:hypothetical protein [Burkholderia pseudomallei]|uniref:hypothetical protein n=1 Tax=Burkholderia pseudomallei TaxID=28450 RepID=UPI0012AEC814|nr:hypothetical protein [Burkholderia pseudomallei]
MRRIRIAAASDASARLRPLRSLQPSSSLLVSFFVPFSFFVFAWAWAWAWACIMIAMNRADARKRLAHPRDRLTQKNRFIAENRGDLENDCVT